MKNGWPDFILFGKDGHTLFIEVKSKNDSLRYEQYIVMTILHDLGIDVRISDGNDLGRNLDENEIKIGHELLWDECKRTSAGLQKSLPNAKTNWLKARIDCEVSKKVLDYV